MISLPYLGPNPSALLLAAVPAVALLWWLSTRRPSGAPPGPGFALPILGHLHRVDKDPRAQFRHWRHKYGDVFSLYMGSRLVVVLNGYPVIKEALVKLADVFSERPHTFITERLFLKKGVFGSSGPVWKEQRRTVLEILHDFGMGKDTMAPRVEQEITHFIKAIKDLQGAPADLATITQVSSSNIVCNLVFGQRFNYDDKGFLGYVKCMDENFRAIPVSSAINYMFRLNYLPGDPVLASTALKNMAKVRTLCQQLVAAHHKEHSQKLANTDFVHAYLANMEKRQGQLMDSSLNDANLTQCMMDLVLAGTETMATALRWIPIFLIRYPEVQEKCYKEISDVVGTSRVPSMADKPKLVYLEATILEILRKVDMVPFAVSHGLSRDVTFRGFFIPKDSIVLPCLGSALSDPDVWGDPENFRPDRFIGPDGNLLRKEEFIAFSLGRRVCLGESLARMELFLFLANLIQNFRFVLPEKEALPSLEGPLGLIRFPLSYKVRAILRN